MKKVIVLFLGLVLVGNVFALDFGKIEEVWDKSLDIANTELDNLDFDIPRAEDVEAKVNNEMYITDLECKVAQLESEVRLLKIEKDDLIKRNKELELYILELEYYKKQYELFRFKRLYE